MRRSRKADSGTDSAGFPLIGFDWLAPGRDVHHDPGARRWTGKAEWALPYDLWGTLIATIRLAHGNVGGLYAPPTGLMSLPGAAVILLPCAALISALGLSLQIPGPHNLHPPVWLVAGPYQIALCCVTLFAADALAERLGVTNWKRGLLAVASAGILWSVSARWGHPEDAVAVGLLLYACSRRARARTALAGWLAGAAVCVQPLVLLALPVLLALLPWRRMLPFLVRSALPSAVLLGAAALANWHDTYTSVTSQPELPGDQPPDRVDVAGPAHGQPRTSRPGPFRLATIVLACLCALAVRRRWRRPQAGDGRQGRLPWPPSLLADVLWWAALTLALRSFFEPVMVSYYPWPPMAVALIPAATLGWIAAGRRRPASRAASPRRPRARRTRSGSGGCRWSSAWSCMLALCQADAAGHAADRSAELTPTASPETV